MSDLERSLYYRDEVIKLLADTSWGRMKAAENAEDSLRAELNKVRKDAVALCVEKDAANQRLRDTLKRIIDQVSGGRASYFGDHIGYTPQISENELELWRSALEAKGQG